MTQLRKYKYIKFRASQHEEIQKLRSELVEERANAALGLPDTVAEAVKFYKENRPKLGAAAK